MHMKEKKEIKLIIKRIIIDHAQYSCSKSVLKSLNQKITNDVLIEMSLRSKLINYIRNQESHLTYLYIKNNESVDDQILLKLAKLSFVDFISKNELEKGIAFAEEHFDYLSDKTLLSLVGLGTADSEEFNKIIRDINKEELMSQINSYLFKKFTGRSDSLLHSTVSYYDTLRNNKE